MTHSQLPKLIQALQNPALYPYPIDHFEVIETHISWLILTGRYAYKIKKNVDLGFLDFSTLKKRQHYCYEELRLNARLAPDIYLTVISICGTESKPKLNSVEPAIEYAVKMQQFNPNNGFDQLLNRQQLTNFHIKQTARVIANFHQKICAATVNSEYGTPESIMQPVRENFSQIKQISAIDHPAILQQLADWSEQQYYINTDYFNQRKQAGFIRECHGDLHLSNIALIDEQVIPFDGIEFNPSLFWIDVISEVAFLVMDLLDRQQPSLAFQFLNNYLEHTGDYSGLKLLKFYLIYRAMVRAKVNAICASQASDLKQKDQTHSDYLSYLQLAWQQSQPVTPVMLIMHGVSASGKSWLSEKIIEHFPIIRIRSDVERKRLFKYKAEDNCATEINKDLYSTQASVKTYQHLLQLSEEILNAEYSVIVDATFLTPQQRLPFIQLAEHLNIPYRLVHSYANEKTLIKRIQQRAKLQGNVSDADQQVLKYQLQHQQPLTQTEQKYTIAIDTTQYAHLQELWQFLDSAKCER